MSKKRLAELCDVIVPMRDKPKEFVAEEKGIPWCRIEDVEGKVHFHIPYIAYPTIFLTEALEK